MIPFLQGWYDLICEKIAAAILTRCIKRILPRSDITRKY